jgi:hypothetical protein
MSKIFYMPAPDLQGVWAANGASDTFVEDVSVFKFVTAPNGSIAAYSVCEETSACRLALAGMRRAWMSVVCTSEMFAPASTRAIGTLKLGTAQLQADGGWKTTAHAEITFVE